MLLTWLADVRCFVPLLVQIDREKCNFTASGVCRCEYLLNVSAFQKTSCSRRDLFHIPKFSRHWKERSCKLIILNLRTSVKQRKGVVWGTCACTCENLCTEEERAVMTCSCKHKTFWEHFTCGSHGITVRGLEFKWRRCSLLQWHQVSLYTNPRLFSHWNELNSVFVSFWNASRLQQSKLSSQSYKPVFMGLTNSDLLLWRTKLHSDVKSTLGLFLWRTSCWEELLGHKGIQENGCVKNFNKTGNFSFGSSVGGWLSSFKRPGINNDHKSPFPRNVFLYGRGIKCLSVSLNVALMLIFRIYGSLYEGIMLIKFVANVRNAIGAETRLMKKEAVISCPKWSSGNLLCKLCKRVQPQVLVFVGRVINSKFAKFCVTLFLWLRKNADMILSQLMKKEADSDADSIARVRRKVPFCVQHSKREICKMGLKIGILPHICNLQDACNVRKALRSGQDGFLTHHYGVDSAEKFLLTKTSCQITAGGAIKRRLYWWRNGSKQLSTFLQWRWIQLPFSRALASNCRCCCSCWKKRKKRSLQRCLQSP